MTIEEQLASMPPPLVSEWESPLDDAGKRRKLMLIRGGNEPEYERWRLNYGVGSFIDGGTVRDGNHLAELWRWLVKGEQ